jgi:NADH dehydrogenase [ubiquinone] 1 alpha subcomplex assembly factor 5
VQRHRNEQAIALASDKRRHVARESPGNSDLAAIFEADGEAARKIAISDRGPDARNPRRLGEAACAGQLLGRFQWDSTNFAAAVTQEVDLIPAIDAKAVHIGNDRTAPGAARRKCEIKRCSRTPSKYRRQAHHGLLSRWRTRRTSATVPGLFDMHARALRRDRAALLGPELILAERTFGDCLERIELTGRHFERALLIGCPDPDWPRRLIQFAASIDVRDPGRRLARAAKGSAIIEDQWKPAAAAYDLVVAIGTLDTVNDLPLALRLVRHAMRADGLFIGAFAGGETLPRLRSAMREADALAGGVAPHVHPRIEPSALAPLLEQAGFTRPVVDVDRVQLAYSSFDRLVADLRAMAATNILTSKPKPLSRPQRESAARAFEGAGTDGRALEVVEILHFAAWTSGNG